MEVLNRAIESIMNTTDGDEWEPIVLHVTDKVLSLWKGEVRSTALHTTPSLLLPLSLYLSLCTSLSLPPPYFFLSLCICLSVSQDKEPVCLACLFLRIRMSPSGSLRCDTSPSWALAMTPTPLPSSWTLAHRASNATCSGVNRTPASSLRLCRPHAWWVRGQMGWVKGHK